MDGALRWTKQNHKLHTLTFVHHLICISTRYQSAVSQNIVCCNNLLAFKWNREYDRVWANDVRRLFRWNKKHCLNTMQINVINITTNHQRIKIETFIPCIYLFLTALRYKLRWVGIKSFRPPSIAQPQIKPIHISLHLSIVFKLGWEFLFSLFNIWTDKPIFEHGKQNLSKMIW